MTKLQLTTDAIALIGAKNFAVLSVIVNSHNEIIKSLGNSTPQKFIVVSVSQISALTQLSERSVSRILEKLEFGLMCSDHITRKFIKRGTIGTTNKKKWRWRTELFPDSIKKLNEACKLYTINYTWGFRNNKQKPLIKANTIKGTYKEIAENSA